MSKAFHVCVFCSASQRLDPKFQKPARDFGALAAQQKWHVVYGGGSLGLMGIIADAALESGAAVTGVIPQALKDREIAHPGLTRLEIVPGMHERQRRMMDLADGFVVLPGGMGTLAEFFEALTWKQLGLHDKPIAVVNTGGYWDGLIAQVRAAAAQGFMHGQTDRLFTVFDDLRNLPEFFKKP